MRLADDLLVTGVVPVIDQKLGLRPRVPRKPGRSGCAGRR